MADDTGKAGGGITDGMVFNAILKDPTLILNAMTSRADLLQKLFDPRRDIDEECGYPKVITEQQYRAMYDRELGRRVVNVYPEETWKRFPVILEDPDPEVETDFEIALDALEAQHHLLHYMQRIDELSGIGQYGVMLWGLDDGKPLAEPVDGWETWPENTALPPTAVSVPERRLLYIRVLDASLAKIAGYEQDVKSPRYGLPTYYTLTLADPRTFEVGSPATPPNTTETRVHWTRITHIADNRKTSEVLGDPRQRPVWNRLYDMRKVMGGSGEMYWRGGFPGVSLETQPGLENAELDEERTREMMFNYMNGLQRYLALTGMTAKSLAPQISDPRAAFETNIKAICVTLGVPYRVFMGIEEGVVSGDQATKAWDGRLANRQERYATPMIIDPVLRRLVSYGVLPPTKEPNGWKVVWPDLTVPDEKDKAEVADRRTTALAKYVSGGVDVLVPPMEYLTEVMGLDEDAAASILEAAVEHIEDVDDEGTTTAGHTHTPPTEPEPVPGGEPAPPTPPEPVEGGEGGTP